MLINRRNGLMAGGNLSAKSYVQDGLVAMWDGIENAGWGVHDPNATVWKDLVGSNDISLTMGGGQWLDNGLFLARNPKTTGAFRTNETTYKQIEVVGVELTGTMSYDRHILISFNSSHSFVVGQNRLGFCFASNVVSLEPTYPATSRKDIPFSVSAGYTDENVVDTGKMYYNGVQKAPTGNSITLGGAAQLLNNYGSYQADSNLYCVRLYSRALTADEIAANYAVDKARFGLPDAT